MIMPPDNPNDPMPHAMLDELNRKPAMTMKARNATPDPEMGGGSPNRGTQWGEPGAGVRFNIEKACPLF